MTRVPKAKIISEDELRKLWEWTGSLPKGFDDCAHRLIHLRAEQQPNAPAVCSWDGTLTYKELEDYALRLAQYLMNLGIGPEVVVPLCFEKSMWTTVAILAVMNAGGASVLLDINQPQERLKSIVKEVSAAVVLTSACSRGLVETLNLPIFQVDLENLKLLPALKMLPPLNVEVGPRSLLYVVFTSGSTGVPKGIKITHRNHVTAAMYHADSLGVNSSSRVFDFASYSFDIALHNTVTTLIVGGCICVPREDDRMNNIPGAIASLNANLVHFTPSVARLLSPSTLHTLHTLILGGEAVTEQDIAQWLNKVNLRTVYGPAECGITSIGAPTGLNEARSIGHGAGAVYWVVDPSQPNRLASIGDVGELVIEGPLVGGGYLNNVEQTKIAFIDNPPWLLHGCGGHKGREGRLYRTGDLVYHKEDGSLRYVDRVDSRVEIRGQSIELSEIECKILAILPNGMQVIVEFVRLADFATDVLIAFVNNLDSIDRNGIGRIANGNISLRGEETTVRLEELDEARLRASLRLTLPEYMIPTFFLPVRRIPITRNGKTDRRRLKELAPSLLLQHTGSLRSRAAEASCAPMTNTESTLQHLWSQVLGAKTDAIFDSDNFFKIGGDSLQAMRLVSLARDFGIQLTVALIFEFPCLADLAREAVMESTVKDRRGTDRRALNIPPLYLLGDQTTREAVLSDAMQHCNLPCNLIIDIYPTTPLQEGLLADTAKNPQKYINRTVLKLGAFIDTQRFKAAVEKVVGLNGVLRTRVIQIPGRGSMQIVTDEKVQWNHEKSLTSYLAQDKLVSMGPGDRLSRFGFAEGRETEDRYFVWTMHHSIYDGQSLPMLADQIERAYRGMDLIPPVPYNRFIKHILQQETIKHESFWRSELSGADEGSHFPMPSVSLQKSWTNGEIEYQMEIPARVPNGITLSNLIRAAWALLTARLTSSVNVLFGVIITGRNASITGVENMTGPTISTVPIRVHVPGNMSAFEFLQNIQHQATGMIPFELTGLQTIRRFGDDCRAACDFQSLLVVQPPKAPSIILPSELGLIEEAQKNEVLGNFNSYPLMLMFEGNKMGIAVETSFNAEIIGHVQVRWVIQQLEFVLQQLCNVTSDSRTCVNDIECLAKNHVKLLWEWNKFVPTKLDTSVHEFIEKQIQRQPRAPAICAWDGSFTYSELNKWSADVAYLLRDLGVNKGAVIPLCFEKSKWTTVAMLGVIRTGAAFAAMDSSQPEGRLGTIVNQTLKQQHHPIIMISSAKNENMARRLASLVNGQVATVLVLDDRLSELVNARMVAGSTAGFTEVVTGSSLLNIVFTSGSTGLPKGAMMTHSSFCTGLIYHKDFLDYNNMTRTFDFVSYAFDIAIHNALATLCVGGCLCVPSDDERKNNLERAISSLKANLIVATPSVLRVINPEKVPSLKTVIFGGEAASAAEILHWTNTAHVKNLYGPAECAYCTASTHSMTLSDAANIGRGMGAATWIVDPDYVDRLMPLGGIGELLIEGPIVGAGYFHDPEKTASSFIEDPLWLVEGGRHGRLYKTGDLVRYNEDGTLNFVGRKDKQVKIRGQRVELGEVEYQLRTALPSAGELAVEVIRPIYGEKPILVAFLCCLGHDTISSPHDGLFSVNPETKLKFTSVIKGLSDHLRAVLPEYMVPSVYIPVQNIPKTGTGKVNRKELCDKGSLISREQLAEFSDNQQRSRRSPLAPMEVKLQQLYSHVLGVSTESIGIDDSFLMLGGDSISAMQLVAACRKEGISISISKILLYKTIAKVAPFCNINELKIPSCQDEPPETIFPLSSIQRWFFQLNPDGAVRYNQSFLMRLNRKVCPLELSHALKCIVKRHPMLRARFLRIGSQEWTQMTLSYHDSCYRYSAHEFENITDILPVINKSQNDVDLIKGPVFTVDLCNIKGADQCLYMLAHHLVIDLVSWRIIWQELEELLQNRNLSEVSNLSYQSWCNIDIRHTQEISDLNSVLPYSILNGDFDFWRMHGQENYYEQCHEMKFKLDASTTSLLLGISNLVMGVETLDVIVSVWLLSFQQTFSERQQPSLAIESHGRRMWDENIDVGETVGWFTAFLPFQVPWESVTSIADVVQLVKEYRRKVEDNGRAYFSCSYLHPDGPNKFSSHQPTEISINYAGVYQQLNRNGGLLSLEDRLVPQIPDVGGNMRRHSLFEIEMQVVSGIMTTSFMYNSRMQHSQRVIEWVKSCEVMMQFAAQTLPSMKPRWSTRDFSQLTLSHCELDQLQKDILAELKIDADDVEDIYPCTAMQIGILIAQSKEPWTYSTSMVWEIVPQGQTNILRTHFLETGHERHHFVQVVQKSAKIYCINIRSDDESFLHALDSASLDEDGDPLPIPNLIMCHTSSGKYYCKLNINHAMTDGTSIDVLKDEFEREYFGYELEQPAPKYNEFVKYERGLPAKLNLDYWIEYMTGSNPCQFPPLGNMALYNAPTIRTIIIQTKFSAELQIFCQNYGVTQSVLLQAAWAIVLRQYTGLDDVCFGILASGRDAPIPNMQNAVGLFVSMMICRIDLKKSLSEVLHQISRDNAIGLAHQNCSLAAIQQVVNPHIDALFNTAMTIRRELHERRADADGVCLEMVHYTSPTEYRIIIDAVPSTHSMEILFQYMCPYISDEFASSVAGSLERAIQSLASAREEALLCLGAIGSKDLDRIWHWNNEVPTSVDMCVHHVIAVQVDHRPQAPAVHAWNGDLSYNELDSYSTYFAQLLIDSSTLPKVGAVVPLCFEKSMWAVVAILAVLKAGAAFTLIDVNQTEKSLADLVEQLGATIILSSLNFGNLARRLKSKVIVIDKSFLPWPKEALKTSRPLQLPLLSVNVTPDSLLCVIFTSGTTGISKGAKITHSNFSSMFLHHAKSLKFTTETRLYDSASYNFSVAVASILTTLAAGGCVCIPRHGHVENNVAKSIVSLNANLAILTPTSASFISTEEVPPLKTLALYAVIQAYGQAECTGLSTVTDLNLKRNDTSNIGRGVGCLTWIVDAMHSEKLVPIGAVGELLLEGPIIGSGYLHNNVGFIKDPPWLLQGIMGHAGRRGRLFKTGDLVRYNMDGTLNYVGRKDTESSLHGSRVNLGEVENCVQSIIESSFGVDWAGKNAVEVAAEVIVPKGEIRATLAAFVRHPSFEGDLKIECIQNRSIGDRTTDQYVSSTIEARRQVTLIALKVSRELSKGFPRHMIPSVYIPLHKIPITVASRTDRYKLRELGSLLSAEQLVKTDQPSRPRQPRTNMERRLRKIWATVLDVDFESIGIDFHFFRWGGSSLAAMRLVSLARDDHIKLSVSEVFRLPILVDMARTAVSIGVDTSTQEIPPFFLVQKEELHTGFIPVAAKHCQVAEEDIEDIYPATAMQEGLFASTTKSPNFYVQRSSYVLPRFVDITRFKAAWKEVTMAHPILRTRLVLIKSHLYQVVIRNSFHWTSATNFNTHLEIDKKHEFKLGSPLDRFALIQGSEKKNTIQFLWTSHHASYDAHSLSIILPQIQEAYESAGSVQIKSPVPFSAFIDYTVKQKHAALDWWKQELENVVAPLFPPSSFQESSRSTKQIFNCKIAFNLANLVLGITTTTVLRLAWVLTVRQYSGCDDVLFGETLSGRNAPVSGIEEMTGPTLTTVPVRIRLESHDLISHVANVLAGKYVDHIPFAQVGMQEIRRVAKADFNNLFMIEMPSTTADSGLFENPHIWSGLENFTSFPLMIVCAIEADGAAVKVEAIFDEQVISKAMIPKILGQFEHIIMQIEVSTDSSTVESLQSINQKDWAQIELWNSNVPATSNFCLHQLLEPTMRAQADKMAVYAWDRELTYGELDRLSNRLARYLVKQGVKSEHVVPICFEKSAWAIVAMLGIIKAGGAFVPLDPYYPEERIEFILEKTEANIVLCSSEKLHVSNQQIISITINEEFFESIDDNDTSVEIDVKSDNVLYVIFTSGSTGTPKGCMIEHGSWCSGAIHHGKTLQFDESSRTLQFSSYSYDISIEEIFTTLLFGGTVCVPSEFDRKNNLEEVIQRMKVNTIDITPSLASILNPENLPDVKICLVGGEPLTRDVCKTWIRHVKLFNVYGPTECTIQCTATNFLESDYELGSIGKAMGCVTWVVDIGNHTKLLPIGAVGELLIEGPIVGRGYLSDDERTAVSFIDPPPWLVELRGTARGKLYKTGDMVRYLEDGSLAFVGRKDNQIKIRGQRIELEEVEHHVRQALPVSQMPDIPVTGVAAEVIKSKQGSSSRLVVFLETNLGDGVLGKENQVDGILLSSNKLFVSLSSSISATLAKSVPSHMIPVVFIPLQQMPIGSTGKLDRKYLKALGLEISAIPAPSVDDRQQRQPTTQQELTLQELWAEVLCLEKETISLDDNFLQLGGDSITAMRLVELAKAKGLSLTLPQLFANPQLSVLASQLAANGLGKLPGLRKDHLLLKIRELERLLDQNTMASRCSPPRALGTIFLTGANGFLGIRLLRRLLALPVKVIALVRPLDGHTAVERVVQSGKLIEWRHSSQLENLEIWQGNLALPNLGLDERQIRFLHSEIDVIIHNGAIVNWNADYETLKPANVDSTIYLLRAAQTSHRQPQFMFISGGISAADRSENGDLSICLQLSDACGYAQTKFVSESLVKHCSISSKHQQGQFSSLMPGLIIGGLEDGAANSDDFIWRLAAAVIDVGGYNEEDAKNWLCIASADRIADIIVDQMTDDRRPRRVDVEEGLTVQDFWDVFKDDFGYDIQPLPKQAWIQSMKNLLESAGSRHVFYAAQPFLEDSDWVIGSNVSEPPSTPADRELTKRCVRQNIRSLRAGRFFGDKADESGAQVARLFKRSGLGGRDG